MTEPRPDRVRVSGPLALFADGFRMQLVEQGYTAGSVQFQLQLLAHLSGWMKDRSVAVGELSPLLVERFLVDRRRRYASRISLKGLCRPTCSCWRLSNGNATSYRDRMVKRGLPVLGALYVTAMVVAHAQERRGVIRCDCREDCWCKRSGFSAFRWTFPVGHSLS